MDSLDLPLVMLAFLQADCTTNSEYGRELLHIGQEISKQDINCNAPPEDGDLETDGHMPSCIPAYLQQFQPSAELGPYGNRADAAILNVAEGLRDIAAQLEHRVVAQATHNLNRHLDSARPEEWGALLSQTVDSVMKHSASLRDLPQERVLLAVTLSLVRGVCVKAPRLLRSLFYTTLQCVRGSGGSR